jgi:hypothetical protein
MTALGWLSIITTVLVGWMTGFAMGRAMEGAAIDWRLLASAAVLAAVVYGVTFAGHRRRPSPYARYKKVRR